MRHEVESSRIALIGPVAPYRGGIAQYTTMLHRTLGSRADLLTISFSRQYPRWLYPGRSDRDAGREGYAEPRVRYVIDSLNPVSWHRAARLCGAHRAQAVVLPWSTVYWAPCFFYLARRLKRAGVEVIFICHNVVEHETAAWKRQVTRIVLGQASSFVVQSRHDRSNIAQFLPDARIAVHAHPILDQFPEPRHTLPRSASLELLFYGFVRPYKGLDVLVEAMGLLKNEDIHLTIAGEFWSGRREIETRISQLGLWGQIQLEPRFVSPEETAEYFGRADVVVLPYRSATGSAVIPLAYRYSKPVIATRTGGLPEVVLEGRTGYTVPPNSPVELAEVIRRFPRQPFASFKPAIDALTPTMTWSSLAGVLLDLARPRQRESDTGRLD